MDLFISCRHANKSGKKANQCLVYGFVRFSSL